VAPRALPQTGGIQENGVLLLLSIEIPSLGDTSYEFLEKSRTYASHASGKFRKGFAGVLA
jgi:hypothetical protein